MEKILEGNLENMKINYQHYYSIPEIRQACHNIKLPKGNPVRQEALERMCSYFLSLGVINKDSVIIPVPQHSGMAEYTKEIAEYLAARTHARCMDILQSKPHMPRYEQKMQGKVKPSGYFLTEREPTAGKIFLLDNVIGTGETFLEIQKLFQRQFVPLVYAVDFTNVKNDFLKSFNIVNEKEKTKMANENTTIQKYEMTAEEAALRNELASSMADKAAKGEAVWQVKKEDRPIMHMPVNPRTGNYFQNGTALMLMQAQYEMKTADNRWISARALNVMKAKEGKDVFVNKDEKAVTLVSGGKPVKYFNYSQIHGKDVPNSIEIIDKSMDAMGERMLNYMDFKANTAQKKAEVTKDNFWELGRKAHYSAKCLVCSRYPLYLYISFRVQGCHA